MKETYTRREMLFALVVLVISVLVSFSLLLDLRQARNNERTLSRMIYEIGKSGRTNTAVHNYENQLR